jgi:hypothetical protein
MNGGDHAARERIKQFGTIQGQGCDSIRASSKNKGFFCRQYIFGVHDDSAIVVSNG